MTSSSPQASTVPATIVVAPREKLSALPASLACLIRTVPADVRILVCQPRLPANVRREALAQLAPHGCAELIELEADVIPHRARAIGAARAKTPWVVFADNDLEYETGWFEALTEEMQRDRADVLAPLIFIGPPVAKVIHHAGGILEEGQLPGGRRSVRERHRLMDTDINDREVCAAIESEAFETCDVAEFHCLAVRRELLETELALPQMLITREQQDLALRCRRAGLRVRFVKGARVTYMAGTPFTDDDLRYHAARWSEKRALCSLDYMEATWNLDFDRPRVLHSWIENHRRRPFRERRRLLRLLPRALEARWLRRNYGYTV